MPLTNKHFLNRTRKPGARHRWLLLRAAALVSALVANFAVGDAVQYTGEFIEPSGRNTLVPAGHRPYAPGPSPDRVVLTASADPAREQTVNWRTVAADLPTEAQIAPATRSVGLHLHATNVAGKARAIMAENGLALHHSVTFEALAPDTLYAYRVRGLDTWSEWFQFRTAKAESAPFSFLYFGDAQNSAKSHFSRAIREAHRELARPALALHAGDLVNLREGIHDDEWGEWFAAGSFLHAMTPQLVVAGNHEHISVYPPGEEPSDDNEIRVLSPQFAAQFTVPGNGPAGFENTVYAVRYQNTLFVALDSTQALDSAESAAIQADWLDQLLTADNSDWVIVSHHHPLFSVSQGRDNPVLREYWKPVYDRHGVDLVLQGHDHTYGRGDNVAEGVTLRDGEVGTVYVVSVAGPKMYRVSDQARRVNRRVGEDVQLFQIVHVEADVLRFEARHVTGEIYDAFDIVAGNGAPNRLVERRDERTDEARCENPEPPREDRCWDGKELTE